MRLQDVRHTIFLSIHCGRLWIAVKMICRGRNSELHSERRSAPHAAGAANVNVNQRRQRPAMSPKSSKISDFRSLLLMQEQVHRSRLAQPPLLWKVGDVGKLTVSTVKQQKMLPSAPPTFQSIQGPSLREGYVSFQESRAPH